MADPESNEKFFIQEHNLAEDPLGKQAMKLVDFSTKGPFFTTPGQDHLKSSKTFESSKHAMKALEANKLRITEILNGAK